MKAILIIWTLTAGTLFAQRAETLSLEACMEAAEERFGGQEFEGYYQRINELNEELLKAANYPKFNLAAQLSHQSDVVSFPENPMLPAPEIPRTQYRIALEIQQLIYDGGRVGRKMDLQKTVDELESLSLSQRNLRVRSLAASLYVSLRLYRQQLNINEELLLEFKRQLEVMESAKRNGAFSELDLERFRLMVLDQKKKRDAAFLTVSTTEEVLSFWTGLPVSRMQLEVMDRTWPEFNSSEIVQLQQLKLQQTLEVEKLEMERSKKRPMVAAFGQAGIGQPNPFNFFDTELSGFYLLGIKLDWGFLNYGEFSKKSEIAEMRMTLLEDQMSVISEEMKSKLMNLKGNYDCLEQELKWDQKRLESQDKISKLSKIQFEQGVMSSSEYLNEVNKYALLRQEIEFRNLQKEKLLIESLTLINDL